MEVFFRFLRFFCLLSLFSLLACKSAEVNCPEGYFTETPQSLQKKQEQWGKYKPSQELSEAIQKVKYAATIDSSQAALALRELVKKFGWPSAIKAGSDNSKEMAETLLTLSREEKQFFMPLLLDAACAKETPWDDALHLMEQLCEDRSFGIREFPLPYIQLNEDGKMNVHASYLQLQSVVNCYKTETCYIEIFHTAGGDSTQHRHRQNALSNMRYQLLAMGMNKALVSIRPGAKKPEGVFPAAAFGFTVYCK